MPNLHIRRTAGALGAEISGVDLSGDLEDATIAAIRAAFVEHQVIFFRDQSLTPEQQLAFGRRFGRLNIHPYVAGMAAHPEVMEIIKEPQDRVNFGGGWHSDMSFLEHPSIGSILYAVELPDYGGDTLFASQAAAQGGNRDILPSVHAHSRKRARRANRRESGSQPHSSNSRISVMGTKRTARSSAFNQCMGAFIPAGADAPARLGSWAHDGFLWRLATACRKDVFRNLQAQWHTADVASKVGLAGAIQRKGIKRPVHTQPHT